MLRGVLNILSNNLIFRSKDTSVHSQLSALCSYVPQNEVLKKVQITCLLKAHAFHLGWALGFRKEFLSFGEDLLSTCVEHDLNDIAFPVSRKIMRHHGIMGSKKDFDTYRKITHRIQRAIDVEIRTEQLLCSIIRQYKAGQVLNHISFQELRALNEYVGRIGSFKFHNHYYYALMIEAEIAGDLDKSIYLGLKAYKYFSSLEYDHKDAKSMFISLAVDQMINAGKHNQVKEYLDKIYEYSDCPMVQEFKNEVIEKLNKRLRKVG